MTHRILLVLSALSTVGLVGCCGPATGRAAAEVLTASDAETLMAAAQETLGRMLFVMDKYDVEAGYLRTRPLRAGQFFEPWRQDNASAQAFARANTDSLRRTVEVFVEPGDSTATQLRCVVTVERLAMPPLQIRSMSRLAGLYTDSTRTRQTLTLEPEQLREMEWVGLGQDHALEDRILTQIQHRLRKG